jgi:hypothetical protein
LGGSWLAAVVAGGVGWGGGEVSGVTAKGSDGMGPDGLAGGVGPNCVAGAMALGRASDTGAGGVVRTAVLAPRSLAGRAVVSLLGASNPTSHTDTLPKVKPNVIPANKMAAAANLRRRSVSASLCI